MRRCPACGSTYAAGDFCPMDGASLIEVGAPDPEPPATASLFTGGPQIGGAAVAQQPDPWSAPVTSTDPAELMAGETLDGRYRLDARIGAGGMGIVYRATHVLIDKAVAVKVLRAAHATELGVAKRFSQEAKLASKIKHPYVVPIFDYGTSSNGCPYYVMDFLRGHSLAWEIDNVGALEPGRALRVAIQIAAGLSAAHEHGVIHRDLKPDNVFLEPGPDGVEQAKLLDFGIARQEGRKTRLTAAGAVVGTPEYMSPEQAQGNEVDARTDIYALGVILFEMLTAQVPFRADSMVGVLTKQVFDTPPPLREIAPDLPHLPQTEVAIARMLAKSADERPPSAMDAIALMERAAEADLGTGDDPAGKGRATVAIGSWSVGDSVPRVASPATNSSAKFMPPGGPPMASFAPAMPATGAPRPVEDPGSAPAAVPGAGPADVPTPVRDPGSAPMSVATTPAAAPPAHGRPITGPVPVAQRGPSWAPLVILGVGAAVAAALLTFGAVRYFGGARAGTTDPVSTPSPEGGDRPQGSKQGRASNAASGEGASSAPGPAEPPVMGDPSKPAPTQQAQGDTDVDAEPEDGSIPGGNGGEDTKGSASAGSKKSAKPNKSKKASDKAEPAPPEATPEPVPEPVPAPTPAPKDPPPAPSVSLGDLKDPFSDP